jgi:hypothetical protein
MLEVMPEGVLEVKGKPGQGPTPCSGSNPQRKGISMKAIRKTTRKTASKKQKRSPNDLKLRRHPKSDELRLLPVAALVMDSVILDNQADHLVVTLRIPKAAIRNNILLLKGLIDEGRLSRHGGGAS